MGIVATEIENILNGYFSGTSYTTPTNLYLALYNAEPTSGNSEVSYTGYSRISLTNQMSQAINGYVSNINQITFGENQDTNDVTITHFAVCSNNTIGDDNSILFAGELIESVTLSTNYALVFDAGTLKIEIN